MKIGHFSHVFHMVFYIHTPSGEIEVRKSYSTTDGTPDRLSELLAGNAFQISLQPNWQIDNGFFNRQILALGGTQLRAQNNNYSAVHGSDGLRS